MEENKTPANHYRVLVELYKFQMYNVEGYWDKPVPFVFCSKQTVCSKSLKVGLGREVLEELAQNGGVM